VHPVQGTTYAIFFSLSLIFACAFLVFGLILGRSLVRLWTERRSGQMGSRFKVKMVLGAMGISLLPVVFMFLFSYALVNRTLNAWFPRPLEIANEQSQILLNDLEKTEFVRLSDIASQAASHNVPDQTFENLSRAVDAFWIVDSKGKVAAAVNFTQEPGRTGGANSPASMIPVLAQTIASGAQVWKADGQLYLAGHAPLKDGTLYAARHLASDFLDRYAEIKAQTDTYAQQHQDLRAYKNEILGALMLMTLVLLFTTTWVALFLSKQVTVPIQGLAEATREISRGNFDHRIEVEAQDELGTLVRSFNRMTEQLGEGRE
jgi:nitrogen fixation/metabolism regulation signal transduction histidine kinase